MWNEMDTFVTEFNRLYEQMELSEVKDFHQVESDFFMLLYKLPESRRVDAVVAFVNISNWKGISLRDGVWTYYESANMEQMNDTVRYLKQTGKRDLASIFEKGIHDYQNPKYAMNFDYPTEWMVEAEVIDDWIMSHEKLVSSWQQAILCEYRDSICASGT